MMTNTQSISKTINQEEWSIPSWMEPYRKLIDNPGFNTIEELLNDHETYTFENVVKASFVTIVKSQIFLLHRLHKKGII